MTRLRGSTGAIVLLAGLTVAGCSAPPDLPRSGARHLVMISLDTTRADHFGFYGNRTVETPNLDRFAAESIVFDDFMTVAPTTLASHASLFTGNYPHTHGVPRNGFLLHDDNLMLAEILAGSDFRTAGFAGSFALSGRFGIAQGFAHYDESFDRQAGEDGRFQNERRAESVTDAVLDYVDDVGTEERLFLFAHYFDPHSPYAAPAADEGPGWFATSRECSSLGGEKTADGERLALQYAGEISYMDHHVGRLLDGLRERGITDDAVVVVTSDHGENFWEHVACFDHGWSTYQTTIRSVGVLRLPGGRDGGRRIANLAASIDILPTVLDLLGVPAAHDVEGEALDLSGQTLSGPRFGQATKPWEEVETDPRWRNMLKARFVREGSYKFIQVPYSAREELYDLERDPGEATNLLRDASPESTARAADLRTKLEAWADSAKPLPAEFDLQHRDDTIERLRSLGYLD